MLVMWGLFSVGSLLNNELCVALLFDCVCAPVTQRETEQELY